MRDALANILQPKERLQTIGFTYVTAMVCTQASYRDSVETVNRLFHREMEDTIRLKTLSDRMDRIGNSIQRNMSCSAKHVLEQCGFDGETGLPKPGTCLPENITGPGSCGMADDDFQVMLQEAIQGINGTREEKIKVSASDLQVEPDPGNCVYISIDDIGVKRQKDKREENAARDTKFVENTVAHIQYGDSVTLLTAVGMLELFKIVLAFLLSNGLLGHRLVFFSDGAKDIKGNIESVFAFHPHTLILDWFHLKKKCKELLSMAIQGKNARNKCAEKLLRYLWVGDVQGAKDHLANLPGKAVKNPHWQEELIAYLERKKDNITCYAVRAKLGLRNSSNPVEKANDLLVAERQKHNGMSWTPHGSGALAAIQMVFKNDQAYQWFSTGTQTIIPDPCEKMSA